MATRTIKITGLAQWAKVFEQNRDMEGWNNTYAACDGAYTIDLILDTENFDKLKEAGCMAKGTPTDEGMKVKLKRKHIGPFESASGPPAVSKADNSVWDYDTDGTIGNFSTVEVDVSCYDIKAYAGSVGTRFDKVKVTDHVVFVRDEDVADVEELTI